MRGVAAANGSAAQDEEDDEDDFPDFVAELKASAMEE